MSTFSHKNFKLSHGIPEKVVKITMLKQTNTRQTVFGVQTEFCITSFGFKIWVILQIREETTSIIDKKAILWILS